MTRSRMLQALGPLYAIALVLTALLTSGRAVTIVAIVGAMLIGLAYFLFRPDHSADGLTRQEYRARRRTRRGR